MHFFVKIYLAISFGAISAMGAVPEGLDAQSFSKSKGGVLYLTTAYTNPSWVSDYQSGEVITTFKLKNGNLFNAGFMMTTTNEFINQNGYFLKYDLGFGKNHSLSFKLTHLELNYIHVSKNTASLLYGYASTIGKMIGPYFLFGAYYRTTHLRGANNRWSPVNFDGNDFDIFFEFVLGTRIALSKKLNMFVDGNNRDSFHSHNLDNIALDLGFIYQFSKTFSARLTSSTRFSAMLSGTSDIGEQKVLFTLINSL